MNKNQMQELRGHCPCSQGFVPKCIPSGAERAKGTTRRCYKGVHACLLTNADQDKTKENNTAKTDRGDQVSSIAAQGKEGMAPREIKGNLAPVPATSLSSRQSSFKWSSRTKQRRKDRRAVVARPGIGGLAAAGSNLEQSGRLAEQSQRTIFTRKAGVVMCPHFHLKEVVAIDRELFVFWGSSSKK